jgi:4-amino-4-deoxy-L-arabinose transferase-like glycosyltransferase
MVLVGGALRALPHLAWPRQVCVRDECTYLDLAEQIVIGNGIVGTKGWLWAPAYPWLMAVHADWLGDPRAIIVMQIVASIVTAVVIREVGTRTLGPGVGRLAAWIWILSPTVIFYSGRLWSETLYALLLVGAVACVGRAREGSWKAAAGLGLLVGLCVLFRGVAQYMLPIFMGVLVAARRLREAMIAAVCAALVVTPYSLHATKKFGGFVLSDRTLGQMMWLGNNEFSPVTFDWGNGLVLQSQFDRVTATGRPHCQYDLEPTRQDTCEVERGVEWIKANPTEFVARMPLRVAQMLNPHTFLTRHLRMGKYKGLPQWLDEGLVVGTVGLSAFTLLGGAIGIVAWGRSWLGLTTALVVGYHVGAISLLAGLTRYRFPLEPLWLLFACAFVLSPRESLARLRGGWGLLAVVLTGGIAAEMVWFLPTGWQT